MEEIGAGWQAARRWRIELWVWGPVGAYCMLIFYLSSLSYVTPIGTSDKFAHFCEYSILGILWARALRYRKPAWPILFVLLSTTVFTGVYGASDEWHQAYVPGRVSDMHDAFADVAGGTFGGSVYLLWQWMRESVGKRSPILPLL